MDAPLSYSCSIDSKMTLQNLEMFVILAGIESSKSVSPKVKHETYELFLGISSLNDLFSYHSSIWFIKWKLMIPFPPDSN